MEDGCSPIINKMITITMVSQIFIFGASLQPNASLAHSTAMNESSPPIFTDREVIIGQPEVGIYKAIQERKHALDTFFFS